MVYVNPMDFVETKKFKSKRDEFYEGDWKKQKQKTFVTLETEIPELPKGIEEPNEAAFKKKLDEIFSKIKDLGGTIRDKNSQFGELIEQKHD